MFNINIPLINRPFKGVKITSISSGAGSTYLSLFQKDGDGFKFGPQFMDPTLALNGSDMHAIFADYISVSVIYMTNNA